MGVGQRAAAGRRLAQLAAVTAALLLTACGNAHQRDQGGKAEEANLPRIVSLNPCVDAILVEVAEPYQVLALSHYSRDPASSSLETGVAARFEVTGGTVEEVLALDPDLVLAGGFLAPSTRTALERLNLQTQTFGIAGTPEQSFEQIRRIAALANQEARGEDLIMRIKVSLSTLRNSGAPLSAVLWQPGQIVPGEETLVGAMMRQAGFTSHSAAQGLGQADYLSLEQMLANPPDVLLIAGSARGQSHPALANLTHTRIESFDPSLLYCGGPTIIRAAERLAEIRASVQGSGG